MPQSDPRCDDLFYTKQFFANTRIGHASPTAEFGTPAMVWQVSVWPRRHTDPHEFDMHDGQSSGPRLSLKSDDRILEEHGEHLTAVMAGFNRLLTSLKQNGCIVGRDRDPFPIGTPDDWDFPEPGGKPLKPFAGIQAGSCSFTLWWPDRVDKKASLLAGRQPRQPLPTDLRVRVEATAGEHFSTVMFILDAGKPWDGEPVESTGEARVRGLLGERRADIFGHVEKIREICEKRIKPQAPHNAPLVDLPPLPERIRAVPPDPADEAAYEAWLKREKEAAAELKAAADYLYGTIWDEFREDFDFGMNDITGDATEVFANFRGLVMSTDGVVDPAKPGKKAAHAGTQLLPRFTGGHDPLLDDHVEPKSVVQAFQPFMRRFRPHADWRDWIACGIFGRRAIYISPLGSRSEYRDLDEGNLGTMIPAENLPPRLKREMGLDPDMLAKCKQFIGGPYPREAPESGDDRPAPFRYLILTKHAPNRQLIGRMIDRVNMTGVRRLYALKNWTILQQAGSWVRVYSQKLDEAYAQWIDATKATRDKYEKDCDTLWSGAGVTRAPAAGGLLTWLLAWLRIKAPRKANDIAGIVDTLKNREAKAEAVRALALRTDIQEKAVTALLKLCDKYRVKRSLPRKLFLLRARDGKKWRAIQDIMNDLRERKEERDIRLARNNQDAELALVTITRDLDRLGKAAIGGLTYRISRSRYFADLFRRQAKALEDSDIETWWSYSRFARRGMEPTLQLIEGIGESYAKLHEQLKSIKDDILQSSINNQTESTRDNTYKLERIQSAVGRVADASEKSTRQLRLMQILYYLLLVVGAAMTILLSAELVRLREIIVHLFS
jgi:hypothetical protein